MACTGTSVKGAQPQADRGDSSQDCKWRSRCRSATPRTTLPLSSHGTRPSSCLKSRAGSPISMCTPATTSRRARVLMQIDPTKQAGHGEQSGTRPGGSGGQPRLCPAAVQPDQRAGAAGVVAKQDLDQAKIGARYAQSATEVAGCTSAGTAGAAALLSCGRAVDRNRRRHSGPRRRPRDHDHDADHVDKPGSLEAYIYVPVERSSQLKMNMPVQIRGRYRPGDGR